MKNAKRNQEQDQIVIYALAHTEAWLEAYSKTHSIPFAELTNRVATLLLAQANGPVGWPQDHLSPLRRTAAKMDSSMGTVEVAGGAYRNPRGQKARHTLSAAGRRAVRKAQKLRWAKYRAAQAVGTKRRLTPRQLKAMRQNAAKARRAWKKKSNGGHMRPSSRKLISEARKAYWAAKRQEQAAAQA